MAGSPALVGVAISPVLLLLVATGVLWISGEELPAVSNYARFSGTPVLATGAFAAITLAAAIGEEAGWRGFALPRLQRRFSPLIATLILAPLWWLWHLQFFIAELTLGPGYLGYLPLVTCIAIILTWLYNRTGGSLLLVIVWHGLVNFVSVTAAVGDHQHLARGTRRTAPGPRTGGTAPCPNVRSGRR